MPLELKMWLQTWNSPHRKTNKFNMEIFSNPIICLDGDESGQKAALRIAEKLFSLINEENKIFFYFTLDQTQMILLNKMVKTGL